MSDHVVIWRAVHELARCIGLTKTEETSLRMQAIKDLKDKPSEFESPSDWAKSYKENYKYEPISAEQLKEARLLFELSFNEMGVILGYKPGPYVGRNVSSLERGAIPIGYFVSRMVRVLLTGYRPVDWPATKEKPEKQKTTTSAT